jgi:hypothetical protein
MAKNASSGAAAIYTMTERLKRDVSFRDKKRQECEAMLAFLSRNPTTAFHQYRSTLQLIADIERVEERCLDCEKFTYYGKTCNNHCIKEAEQ